MYDVYYTIYGDLKMTWMYKDLCKSLTLMCSWTHMFQTTQETMKLVMNKQFTQLKDKKDQGRQCAMNCVITLANK